MDVYVMSYAGRPVGVFSSKRKMLKTFVSLINRKVVIEDLENALNGKYRFEYDRIKDMKKETIEEMLKLFKGEPYDMKKFTYEDVVEASDWDFDFTRLEINKVYKIN